MLPALRQAGMWYSYSLETRFSSFAFWWFSVGLICFAVKELFPKRLMITLLVVVFLFSFSLYTIDSRSSEKKLIVIEPSDYLPIFPKAFIYTTESGLNLLAPENEKKTR